MNDRVLAAFNETEMLDLARSLIKIPSFTTGETACTRLLADYLGKHGFETQLMEVDPGRYQTIAWLRGKDSIVYAYEGPAIDQRLEELGRVVDPVERARLLQEIWDQKFNEFAEIPLFWLFAEAAINPKFIAEYVFPGVITGYYTHLEYIKLAP